jgi:predicted acetyltransferase
MNNTLKMTVRQMWKTCFGDSDEFLDIFFTYIYKDENTLLYIENDVAVASLQMPIFQFTFCGKEIPAAYICGACTLPEYRNKGYMGKLLQEAFELMANRNIPFSILIPADKWLYGYYAKFGYEKVFEKDEKEIPIKKILDDTAGNIDEAYLIFDKLFRDRDFCIQKTKQDFRAIVEDLKIDKFPVQTNLSGMAKIIDYELLSSLFFKKYQDKHFSLEALKSHKPILNLMFE